jgi:hypothetical protein
LDIKKIIAKLPTGFVDDAMGMDGEQLRAEIIRAETALHEVDKGQKADEKLQGARELVKELVGAYNDAKRAQRAKISYVLHLLEERGELGTGELTGDLVTKEKDDGKKSKKRAA